MERMVSENEAELQDAVKSDFKTASQEYVFEIRAAIGEVDFQRSQLDEDEAGRGARPEPTGRDRAPRSDISRSLRRRPHHRSVQRPADAATSADDDGTRSNADPDRQVLGSRGPLDGLNDLQSRPDSTLSVFFVCGGPAAISQDAITHVAGDKPVVSPDHSLQQGTQLLGVELFTQRRSNPPDRRTSP
jgi:hypothetical protein